MNIIYAIFNNTPHMKPRILIPVVTVAVLCNTFFSPTVQATSNYNYKLGEYVVIVHGRSPISTGVE